MDKAFGFSLYLVRHGTVKKQPAHLPAYDAPLTRAQPALEKLCPHLPSDAQWHVSPLQRAQQSCAILQHGTMTAHIDPRLEEQNFGLWHGKSVAKIWPEIDQNHKPHHPASFINHKVCPPMGTSFEDVFKNAGYFLEDLIKQRPQSPQIVVSHAGVTKALLGHMMGLAPAQAMMLSIDHGSVSAADYIFENNLPEVVIPWQIKYLNRLY